jgi:PIN domain nuclease of toxin-antitoxin system
MAGVASDTHALIWYLRTDPRLSPAAMAALEGAAQAGEPIYVSAITIVEMRYLLEKGRIPQADMDLLTMSLSNGVKTVIELVPVTYAVTQSLALIPRAAIPDMPDRIIAATALHLGVPLVSRDRKIQSSSINTIW